MGARFYALRPGPGPQREAACVSVPWRVAFEVARSTEETLPRAWEGTDFEVVDRGSGRPERGTVQFLPEALARLQDGWEPARWLRRAGELGAWLSTAASDPRRDDPAEARTRSEFELTLEVLRRLMGLVREGRLLFLALRP